MLGSWFGMERVAEIAENGGRLGLIGIDLSAVMNEYTFGFRQYGFNWQSWIVVSMGRDDLWFGDQVGNHIWFYARLPNYLPQEEAGSYMHELTGNLRDAIAAYTGDSLTSHSALRGMGYVLLQEMGSRTLRDTIYEGVLKVSAQMFASHQEQDDFERRSELDWILMNRGIKSVYQPITCLSDGRTFGYEALTRCAATSLFDGPLSLFRYAEQENQAYALDKLARETAIRSCPQLGKFQKIFINVTMGIMNDPHFVSGQTIRWLTERGMNPDQVVFELTERNSIEDFQAAKKILAHYRAQGYQIAIDDAGAGYSSLQSIVELNPDYIKVDRSLVQFADRDEMKEHMLRTFVSFAKKMNIRTVAEGIERPEELRLVRSMGFDYGQGYMIGRPSERPSIEMPAGLPNG